MKKIREQFGRWYFVLPLGIVLLMYTSCTKDSTKGINPVPVKNYDAETLFRGLIFGQGEVANAIPEIAMNREQLNLNSVESAAVTSLQNDILVNIKKINPNFLNYFQTKIQSGNRSDIAEVLDETRTVVLQAIQFSYKIPSQLLDKNFILSIKKLLPENASMEDLKSAVNSKKDEIKAIVTNQLASAKTTSSGANPAVSSDCSAANYKVNLSVVYLAGALAVAVAVVITVAAIFVAGLFFVANPDDGLASFGSQQDVLLKDMTVNSIANNLSLSK